MLLLRFVFPNYAAAGFVFANARHLSITEKLPLHTDQLLTAGSRILNTGVKSKQNLNPIELGGKLVLQMAV